MKKIAYLCCTSLILLAACAPLKTPSTTELTATTNTQSTELNTQPVAATSVVKSNVIPTSFILSGAIAAKSHQKGWTAMVDWKQSGPHAYQITLLGPLGSQAVRIEEQQGVVTYREGAKKLSSANGDDLLAKKTGIHLPVNNLYYWVRGLPAPGGISSATRDSNGQLKLLKQAGYTVEYTDYMNAQQHTLPHKIRLSGKDVVVKLVIKRWQL